MHDNGGEEEPSPEALIAEEYAVWKKNSPLLYDWVGAYKLEWPSLTVQWLPEVTSKPNDAATNIHRVILGTHTSSTENDYLLIGEVELPVLDAEIDMRTKPDGSSEGFKLQHQCEIKTRILHDGEVNRARYMPQDTKMIATKSPSSTVYVFDHTQHGALLAKDGDVTRPQHRCLGHTKEGYGLAWSPYTQAHLLSGSHDSSICLWDLTEAALDVQPKLKIASAHKGAVEDVDWHRHTEFVFGSCGDDSAVLFWDARQPATSGPTKSINNAHQGDVHCLSFNPLSEFLLATGGADNNVALWDLRNLNERVHIFEGHQDEVLQVSWAPFSDTILGSSSSDRRVVIWDVGRIGDEQSPEDAECGPPELLFSHGGHTARVSDFSWSSKDDWLVASVSEDNVMQVWQMTAEMYSPDEEEEVDDEDLEGADDGPSSKKQRAV